jgi:hypothetical protein
MNRFDLGLFFVGRLFIIVSILLLVVDLFRWFIFFASILVGQVHLEFYPFLLEILPISSNLLEYGFLNYSLMIH